MADKWTYREDPDDDAGHFTIRDGDDNIIADVLNPYCDYDMQRAYWLSDDCPMEGYARLISAAPELLEALRATTSIVMLQNGNLHNDINQIIELAQAAIAKARANDPR